MKKKMPKRDQWKTKEMKRAAKEQDKGIIDFIKVQRHFFKEMNSWIDEMTDPRNTCYTTYTQQDLIWLGVLKNICSVDSMRQMNEEFNEVTCLKTLSLISEDSSLDELPDFTTLNYYLEKLSTECLSYLRKKMISSLIRSKAFNRNRIQGKYWPVILDGTGLFHFREKHCENCLVTTVTDEAGNKHKAYYHKVLEAKIIFSDSIVLSLGTEFIENESEDVEKQDCENAAAKRLLKRLKEEYPRIQFCILGDGLYSVEPLMGLCRECGWEYLFNLKEGTQKNITKDYKDLDEDQRHMRGNLCTEKGRGGYYNGVEELSGKAQTFNVLEYTYEKKEGEKTRQVKFLWVTSLTIGERKLEELILTGRNRWKIENEGFNNQKNGIYKIEHLNSRDSNAMKNHYLLTQVADILMQLYLNCNRLVKEMGQSIKNTSSRLLKSFCKQIITEEDEKYISRYTAIHLE